MELLSLRRTLGDDAEAEALLISNDRPDLAAAGCSRVAVIRGILAAADVEAATRARKARLSGEGK